MHLNMTHKDKHNYCQQMMKKIVKLVKSQNITSYLLKRKNPNLKNCKKKYRVFIITMCIILHQKYFMIYSRSKTCKLITRVFFYF